MDPETSQLTLQLERYFWLLGKNSRAAWQTLKGQRIHHANYGYGTIDDIHEDCVWIIFDTPDEAKKERNYFPKKGFLKGQFTELKLSGAALNHPSIKSFAYRLRRQQEHEQERIRQAQEQIRLKQELERERIRQKQEAEQRERQRLLKAQKEKEDRERLVKEIEAKLEFDYLSVNEFYDRHPDRALLDKANVQRLKVRFVKDWVHTKLKISVDEEQAAAIAATEGDIQVIARAGSGKTRTLVTRAIFLQQHCQVSPAELLLLAFNTKAVKEIQDRIKKVTDKLPHVMTFHALAYAIIHPEEELIYDDTSASQTTLSNEIQDVIDHHIRSPRSHNLVRDIMLMHFREDWERIIKEKHYLSLEERRGLLRESLSGDFVKSFGEKIIANILFENSIEYKYERNFRWDGVNYRPDFSIWFGKDKGVVIEYFGLEGDPDYDQLSERKREFWRAKSGWSFLEYSPADILDSGLESFERRLIGDLRKLGISTRKRTDEEIWDLIRHRAIDRFTAAIRSFVSRCRKNNFSEDGLDEKVQTHRTVSPAEEAFLAAASSIYRGYLEKLRCNGKEDFDGLMWRAIASVNAGETRFARNKGLERGDLKKVRFILVDEFQDFSEMFYQLSMAIRKKNEDVQFFCVGDDWQAINEFAGSELRFFLDFSKYFNNTCRYHISSNYRSPNSIVQVGNAIMQGLGKPAIAAKQSHGDIFLCPLDKLSPTVVEQSRHHGDEITPATLRLIRHYLDLGKKIVLLSRANMLPWFVNYSDTSGNTTDALQKFREHLLKFVPEEDHELIQISNTHKYKGKENPVVIILDATDGSYPLIHPNWIFLRIFGESVEKLKSAERRLFYVALSRPEESLLIVTDNNKASPYLKDIETYAPLRKIDWNKYPPPCSPTEGARLEIQVMNAYPIKEHLKKRGFRWNVQGTYWFRMVPRQGFIFENLLQQDWVNEDVEIKVYSETRELLYQKRSANGR